ncbi:type I secretion system permease/ATPase [Polaromonas sp. JS666]|uniref:type I secretion system permease/ATPase n=1 Tax=Polaromonas sp. (strain JS666 / ATCC BAA-500) TaxID=296591 RepID=UPI0000D5B479|nr:type I secretion system permease/ATPase [Polaromonas sp. JS666]ABE46802.1 Type I secretion system ATPase, PrtD [Polaromonas sp. JS666]
MGQNTAVAPRNEIRAVLTSYAGAIRSVGFFSMVVNLLFLVPSVYMLQVYDRVLPSRNEYTLLMLTGIVLGLYVFSGALEYVRSLVVIRLGERMDAQLSRRLHTAAFEHNLRQAGGNAGQSIQDLTTLRQFVTGNSLFAFFDAPWFPIYLVLIFIFNTTLGLFALAGTLLLVTLAWVNEAATRGLMADASSAAVASGNLATNSLRNAEVIQAMGMLPGLQRRWYELHQRFVRLQSDASQRAAVIAAFTRFVRTGQQSLVLGLGALLVIEGSISAGMMIAASILVGRALSPVEQLIGAWRQWSAVKSAYGRMATLLATYPEQPTGMALPAPRGRLTLESVTAAPPGAQVPVLRNVSFELVRGDVLGVVGPSASGKSTLARLLVGVWPASAGKVRLDGADVYLWNKQELGPSVGYLPQDIELFAGTISENIARFGEVNGPQVIEAAQLAGVHELILKLPQGYDTPLGDGGAGLSGGQKQRIGLARALYGQPALLVLDEPNSNLDDAGENALVQAIARMREAGSTVVLVAHRGQILKTTSKLLVLRDGVVQLFGPRDGVLQALAQAARESADKAGDAKVSARPLAAVSA